MHPKEQQLPLCTSGGNVSPGGFRGYSTVTARA
jgi:hypothetical protein